MPFRLNEWRAKIQFVTSAEMPSLIHRAAEKHGYVSNTHYTQHALCHALSRDLGIPVERLLVNLPPPRPAVPAFLRNKEHVDDAVG